MKTMPYTLSNITRRTTALVAAIGLLMGVAAPAIIVKPAHAAQLTQRSLTISSSANGTVTTDAGGNTVPAGQGGNGQQAQHKISFTLATSSNVGSVLIMYCDSPIPQATCNTPAGLSAANITSVTMGGTADTTGAALDTTNTNSQINTDINGLGIGVCNGTAASTTRENCVPVQWGTAASETSGQTMTITYGGAAGDYITNPTADNTPFYARIFTFSDTGYTTLEDQGGVAASTAQQIDITAKVQEVLNFSVGPGNVTTDGSEGDPGSGGATCSAVNDNKNGALVLGDSNGVLSSNTQYTNASFFRVNTNTLNGTKIYYSGDTLKSGSNTIASVGEPAGGATGTAGTPQFGLGIDTVDTNSGLTDLSAVNSPTYDGGGSNKFSFNVSSVTTPVMIASSVGPVTCDTGVVRYVGNVSTVTPPGIYTTTITYVATGTY